MADLARRKSDRELKQLERRIKKEYQQAVKETREKLNKYLSKFESLDAEKRKALADGLITRKEYREWKVNKILVSNRWKAMRKTLAQDMANHQLIARNITNGYMANAYAISHNYIVQSITDDLNIKGTFTLYNRDAVESLIRKDSTVLPLPGKRMQAKMARGEVVRWQEGQLQSVALQSILQGESIPQISKRISETLAVKNMNDSIRYARTAMTSAENKGRLDGMKRMDAEGIVLEKKWSATGDDRTRQSHLDIDGESVPPNEEFSNGLMYPGDLAGSADEVWNCRCSMGTFVIGFRRKDGSISYVNYTEGESQHDREIAAERERRLSSGKEKKDSYIFDRKDWDERLSKNNVYDMDAWTEEWLKLITSKELDGVQVYTGSAYIPMNKYLRGISDNSRGHDKDIENCTNALKKASLPETTIVRRGVGSRTLDAMMKETGVYSRISNGDVDFIKGAIIKDLGFMSTSPDPRGGFSDDIEFIIEVPKGAQAMYVDSISRHQGELELLIQRGASFIIYDAVPSGGWGEPVKVYMRML